MSEVIVCRDLKAYRLTLTLPVLNHGANIIFLVAGKNKAAILDAVLREEKGPQSLPAQLVQPMSGRLIWLVEENASLSLRGKFNTGKNVEGNSNP